MHRRLLLVLAAAGLLIGPAASARQAKKAAPKGAAPKAAAQASNLPAGPTLVFEFAKGTVEIETSPSEAPKSVDHIVDLVRRNFYRGQRIWWVTPALLQFGDPTTRDMTKRDGWGTNGSGRSVGVDETKMAKRKFLRGVVGLGYRPDYKPATADSYLFIIKGANSAADGKYAVVGTVTEGMAVVDKLVLNDVIKAAYVKGEEKK